MRISIQNECRTPRQSDILCEQAGLALRDCREVELEQNTSINTKHPACITRELKARMLIRLLRCSKLETVTMDMFYITFDIFYAMLHNMLHVFTSLLGLTLTRRRCWRRRWIGKCQIDNLRTDSLTAPNTRGSNASTAIHSDRLCRSANMARACSFLWSKTDSDSRHKLVLMGYTAYIARP